jgi:DnaJ family protein A protein 5
MESLSTGADWETPSSDLTEPLSTPKLGKAKQKRAKRAVKEAGQPSGFACANCQAPFASKSKLFDHIRELPDHAQPVKKPVGRKGKRN